MNCKSKNKRACLENFRLHDRNPKTNTSYKRRKGNKFDSFYNKQGINYEECWSYDNPVLDADTFNTFSSPCSSFSILNPHNVVSQTSAVERRQAPSKPHDEIVNEIEENVSSHASQLPLLSSNAAEVVDHSAAVAQVSIEDLRKQLAEQAVKAAPPIKPPETPEEIAREEEIQRKIRESIVIINPEQELALLKPDPSIDIEMSPELRALLQTLTTNYLCQLCSVKIVGQQMAAMHYNGKNHLKKLKSFVQTNGRSAGFNMESLSETEETVPEDPKETEPDDPIEVDENKYCKLCKVSFYQPQHARMHYKGKNHAKKLKSASSSNRAEIFECRICCVTVTSQEHLTAHLNGIRHKQQIRKMDANEVYRGYLDCRGRGGHSLKMMLQESLKGKRQGAADKSSLLSNGQDLMKNSMNYTDQELLTLFGIEPSKKFQFDLANYRTPLGWLYCSYCNISMVEDAQFLLHLNSRKHSELVFKRTKVQKSRHHVGGPPSLSRST
ncbi:keratin, type I cytoskeletal 9 [Biomphalaria glabrata]|nr:keratin, type I cytoskeletal 9 [Biomphalaria glabrata]